MGEGQLCNAVAGKPPGFFVKCSGWMFSEKNVFIVTPLKNNMTTKNQLFEHVSLLTKKM